MKKLLTALALTATVSIAAAGGAQAGPSDLPTCVGDYPYYSCKVTTVVQNGYTLTYWYGANGQSHLLKSETTLPRG